MGDEARRPSDEEVLTAEMANAQLRYLVEADTHCRAMQLPEGMLLRYTGLQAMYFYLRNGIRDGKLTTRVFASDSAYEQQKISIGEVTTPMFESQADRRHSTKVRRVLYSWISFVREDVDGEEEFKTFSVEE
jgi:hypothetical protein